LQLYRIAKHPEPDELDFYSSNRLQEPPTPKEVLAPELRDSISMWGTAASALSRARANPRIGEYVAVVTLRPDDLWSVAVHTTPDTPDHYDVWGIPARLAALVSQVLPVRRRAV